MIVIKKEYREDNSLKTMYHIDSETLKKEGLMTCYDHRGMVTSTHEMKQDMLHGLSNFYNKDDIITTEHYEENELKSVSIIKDKEDEFHNQILLYLCKYENKKPLEEFLYDSDGKLEEYKVYSKGDKSFFTNIYGDVIRETMFYDGDKITITNQYKANVIVPFETVILYGGGILYHNLHDTETIYGTTITPYSIKKDELHIIYEYGDVENGRICVDIDKTTLHIEKDNKISYFSPHDKLNVIYNSGKTKEDDKIEIRKGFNVHIIYPNKTFNLENIKSLINLKFDYFKIIREYNLIMRKIELKYDRATLISGFKQILNEKQTLLNKYPERLIKDENGFKQYNRVKKNSKKG